ncbi:MAG: glycosyltransferase family 39 protein [Candidatus Hodarchaeota archaeon]
MNPREKLAFKFNITEIVIIFCVVLFAGILRIPSLPQPLGPDQGIMSVIGEGILQGKLPYKDFWEMGSPAIFFTYALMFKIFGVSMVAIPITDILVSMLTTFLIFLLANSLWNRKVGYVSALLFAFFSNGVRFGMHAGGDIAFGTFWYIAQRETFMLPLIVASIYFIIESKRKDKPSWRLILSGFLAGLAFVYKFPALLIFLCLLLYLNFGILTTNVQSKARLLIKKNLILISGFILSLIPFVLFFYHNGALKEMTDVIFKYVSSVYGKLDHNYLGTIKTGLIRTYFIAIENFILWIFFITSSVYIIANERNKENLLVVVWAIASVLFVISHREFFGYHYMLILPPFTILSGYGVVKALGPNLNFKRMFTEEFEKVFIIGSLLVNLTFFTTLNFMHYTKFYYYITDKISQETYYNFFNAYPKHDYSFPADYKVAQYIKTNTDSDDLIYALGGIESVIYFLTKRKSPSRFIFSWILFSKSHGQVKQAEEYRQELLINLKTKKPKYIIIVRSLNNFEKFPAIYNFIRTNYVLEKTFPYDRLLYVYNKYKHNAL